MYEIAANVQIEVCKQHLFNGVSPKGGSRKSATVPFRILMISALLTTQLYSSSQLELEFLSIQISVIGSRHKMHYTIACVILSLRFFPDSSIRRMFIAMQMLSRSVNLYQRSLTEGGRLSAACLLILTSLDQLLLVLKRY